MIHRRTGVVVSEHLGRTEFGSRVDGHLVDRAGKVRRAVPRSVTADAPVAVVSLRRGVRVGPHGNTVDVERHAILALGGNDLMPCAVVVGPRAGDGVGMAGPRAESQLPAGFHVDVAVVTAAAPIGAAAEPDQFSAARGGGVEPQFGAVHGRVGKGRRGQVRAFLTVESDPGACRAGDITGRGEGFVTEVRTIVAVSRGVNGYRT